MITSYNKNIIDHGNNEYNIYWTDADDNIFYSVVVVLNDNETQTLDEIAEKLLDHKINNTKLSKTEPFEYLTLYNYLKFRQDEVNQLRETIFSSGYMFNENLYDADDRSRQNIIGVVTSIMTGQTLPDNFTWRTKTNTNIPFNNEQLLTFGLTMMAWINTVYSVSWIHKDAMTAIYDRTDKTDDEKRILLRDYDITPYWPYQT